MGETLGLTTNYSRQARHTAPASLRTQDDHAAIVGHTGPLTPPAVILSGALAKLNLFEGRARRVEPVVGTTCGLLV